MTKQIVRDAVGSSKETWCANVIGALLVLWLALPATPAFATVACEDLVRNTAKDVENHASDYSDSLTKFKGMLNAYPIANDEAKRQTHIDIGRHYMRHGPILGAIHHLECAFRKTDSGALQHVIANDLGNAYARNRQWKEALDCYEIARKGNLKTSIEAALNRARLLPPKLRAGAVTAQQNRIKELNTEDRARFFLNARAIMLQPTRGNSLSELPRDGVCPPWSGLEEVLAAFASERSDELDQGHSSDDQAIANNSLCEAAVAMRLSCTGSAALLRPSIRKKEDERLLAELYVALAERSFAELRHLESTELTLRRAHEPLMLSNSALSYLNHQRRRDILYVGVQRQRARAYIEIANLRPDSTRVTSSSAKSQDVGKANHSKNSPGSKMQECVVGDTKNDTGGAVSINKALQAYRLAASAIEFVRQDLPNRTDISHDFIFEEIDEFYLEFVDLLLNKARRGDVENSQACLEEALGIQEKRKQVEQQNYLGDQCVIERQTTRLDQILELNTYALYTIVLNDRVELIEQSAKGPRQLQPWGIKQKELKIRVGKLRRTLLAENDKIDDKTLNQELQDFYLNLLGELLRKPQDAPPSSQSGRGPILIVVPDGVLRLVPFAALMFDDGHYVIEKVAVGIVPGLSVLGTQPNNLTEGRVLLAGIWDFEKPNPALEVGLQTSAKRQGMFVDALDNLRGVEGELSKLEDLMGKDKVKILRNAEFTTENFSCLLNNCKDENDKCKALPICKSELDNTAYRIIHIASHGWFGERGEDNFIVASDHLLDRSTWPRAILESQRGVTLRDNPIELLTLSACQTAQGNDRAPMGLVGAALRARARSVLGSLWSVSDDAARQLMTNFYEKFPPKKGTSISKIEALQQAQKKMIEEKRWHPGSWGSFVLVGNWR
jgi:CHAT domain-containing protein